MRSYSGFRRPEPLTPPDPEILGHLQTLRLVGVGFRGQAQALLSQGFGASLVLEHLLRAEVDPRRKLEVALALADGIVSLTKVAWHLEAHGIHPASMAFAQEPARVMEYLKQMLLLGTFRDWKISGRQAYRGAHAKVEADASLGGFPQGLVLPAWDLQICRNPRLRDLELRLVVSTLLVVGCPGLRSLGLEEPAEPGPYGIDECTVVYLEQCPSLRSLKGLGPLRWLHIANCGGAYIHADPIFTRTLTVRECEYLEALPDVVSVRHDMLLGGLPRLRKLPTVLHLGGDLTIRACPSLEWLPENLEVPGDLILEDLPSLRGLPTNLKVGGTIRVRGCPRPRAQAR